MIEKWVSEQKMICHIPVWNKYFGVRSEKQKMYGDWFGHVTCRSTLQVMVVTMGAARYSEHKFYIPGGSLIGKGNRVR